MFRDCSSQRRLVPIQDRLAARSARLRLVIPPGDLVHRPAELMDLDQLLPVYSSLCEAVAATRLSHLSAPGLPAAPAEG